MKHPVRLLGYIWGVSSLFITCTPQSRKPITFNSEVFTQCDTISPAILATGLRIHYPASMFAMDSIIGIVDFRTSDFFVHLYNEKGQNIGNMVRTGRGFGEITSYNDFIFKKEEGILSFYAHGKIIEYDVPAYLSDSASYIREYPLPSEAYQTSSFYKNALRIGEKKYLCIESFDENRFVTVDEKDCKTYTEYPNITDEGAEKDASVFRYASKMAINSDCSRIAFGTYIGGVLDILQLNDSLAISPVKTVGIYKPIYVKVKNSPDAITWGDDTPIGFEAMDASDKHLYTLLNGTLGRNLKAENAIEDPPFTEKISVFDWNGNAEKQIFTGKKLMAVATRGDSVCYAVAYNDNYSLLKLELCHE